MRGPENAGTGIRLRQRGRNRRRCAGERRWSATVRQNSASTRTPASLSARSRPRRSVVVERWVAPGDWRGVDQRCGRLAVGEEAVEQAAELGDPRQLAGGGLDPDDRGQLVAEPTQIELGEVAGDDARQLHALDAAGP